MGQGIIVTGDANIDPGLTATQSSCIQARIFQSLPGNFHQQAMLRINGPCFLGRDIKKRGIELIDGLFEQIGPVGMGSAWGARVRIIIPIRSPAFFRDL